MKDTIIYKNFTGSVHFSCGESVFFGKIEGIDDLVTFEGDNTVEIMRSFEEAVDDYTLLCEENSRPIQKTYRGSFNIRIPPELHRKAVHTSLKRGLSLYQLVQAAIEKEVKERKVK